jgi:cysteine dioxygenase type I
MTTPATRLETPVGELVEFLHSHIAEWCDSNTIHEKWPRKSCAELAQWVAKVGGAALKLITSDFDNKALYPDRPMIQLSGFEDKEPTTWLLGWRAGEATPIHDHGDSQAGIFVFEGAVSEHIYVPMSELDNIGDESPYRMVVRELLEGSTVRITSPYIHLFQKTCEGHDCVHATTIHCYYPRLQMMNYLTVNGDEMAQTGVIKFVDVWQDVG